MYDFSRPTAEVTQHPTNKTLWGLKNLSDEKWVGTTADGQVRDIAPGRSVTLSVGTKIQFGSAAGEIRA